MSSTEMYDLAQDQWRVGVSHATTRALHYAGNIIVASSYGALVLGKQLIDSLMSLSQVLIMSGGWELISQLPGTVLMKIIFNFSF